MLSFPHRILFIRHGETDWNREGRLQGQRDIPINARGRDQALAAGRLLRQWLGADADAVLDRNTFWASPLHRTRETIDLALVGLDRPKEPYTVDDRLKELSFGRWEGLTWADIRPHEPALLNARKRDKWGFVPPGGESYAMLAVRITDWLKEHETDMVMVSHGGVARTMLHTLTGVPAQLAVDAEIHQGRVLVFDKGAYLWV